MKAWLDLIYRRRQSEQAGQIAIGAIGNSGNGKAIKKEVKRLLAEGE